LAMRKTGQGAPEREGAPWCDCSTNRSTRQIDRKAIQGPKGESWLKRLG
jgi:hypothetical protein